MSPQPAQSVQPQPWVSLALLAAILFQLSILAMEYIGAVYPLWTGQTVKLRTHPVDPRSLFRGYYARLRYDISELSIKAGRQPRQGEVVYVSLQTNDDGLSTPGTVSLRKPTSGLFIRGHIVQIKSYKTRRYQIRYGIEAFFAPPEKALALEHMLRDNAVAELKIADTGRATLVRVQAE